MTGEIGNKPDWLKPLFPWEQRWVTVNGRRIAYVDERDRGSRPVLLLSGNPTWGFLYRDFIKPLTAAGYRAIDKLRGMDIPPLLFWGDKDNITKLGVYFLKSIFRLANDPIVIKDAGHFIQEDKGEEAAQQIVDWMQLSSGSYL